MTTSTIPVFPGDIGAYLDQAPLPAYRVAQHPRDEWETAIEPGLTAGQRRRAMGRASRRKPNRRRASIARGIGAALLVAAALAAAITSAPRAGAAERTAALPSVTVGTPVVKAGGYVKLSVRFGSCVRDVRAWVTSGDDGPDNTRVNRVDASEAKPGTDFTVWVRISSATAAAMPGTWYAGSVQAEACGSGAVVADYVASPPLFQVAS